MVLSDQLHDPAALSPAKEPAVPIVEQASWAPEPVWARRGREKCLPCKESNPGRPARSKSL